MAAKTVTVGGGLNFRFRVLLKGAASPNSDQHQISPILQDSQQPKKDLADACGLYFTCHTFKRCVSISWEMNKRKRNLQSELFVVSMHDTFFLLNIQVMRIKN